jgi:hypothetical protein
MTDQAPTRADTSEMLSLIGTQELPIEVGSVKLNEDGHLVRRADGGPIEFWFRSYGVRFHAQVARQGEDSALVVEGDLGPMPFRGETPDLRDRIVTIMWANHLYDAPIFTVSRGNHMLVRASVPVSPPFTAATLIGGATNFVVLARPYLELIAEILVEAQARRAAPAEKQRAA